MPSARGHALTPLWADHTRRAKRRDPTARGRQYLHEMSRLVLRSNGVVDKFIGDAIVAFWNAPKPVRDHPNVACHTALMSLQRLKLLQRGTALVHRCGFEVATTHR